MKTAVHPLALELNHILEKEAPVLLSLLSELGKHLFFPRGIVTQSNEAKQFAHKYDATIGIATEQRHAMHLPCVKESFEASFQADQLFPYAPSRGLTALREFWKAKVYRDNPELGSQFTSLPIVTSGIGHGLSILGELFFDAGDTVILPDQYWGNYRFLWQAKLKVNLVEFPMFDEALKFFNFQEFRKTLDRHLGKKQAIVFNFPNNPTGCSLTRAEAEKVRDTLVEYANQGSRFVVVVDDAYFGMVWEDEVLQESLFGFLANAHENIVCLKVDGATKEGFMWGFRTGFITAAGKALNTVALETLETKIAGSIRSTISSSSLPAQSIVLKAFQNPRFESEMQEKKKTLKARYREIKTCATSSEYADVWDVYPCQSGYFICLRLKGLDAEAFRKHLLMNHGVGVVSSGPRDIRIAYSCLEQNTIADMIAITAQAAREIKKTAASHL